MQEIERKFLLNEMPKDVVIAESYEIVQFYLCREKDKIVRVRKIADKFNIGFKKGKGMVRLEKEIEISERDFLELLEFAPQNKISKIRYIVFENEQKIEIDEFIEQHKGLIFAEVEFLSRREAENFKPPKWFGKEVTGNIKFTNSYLSSFKPLGD